MLDPNNHQGKFGQDYVRVLASAAGMIIYTPDWDHDGVDLLLRWPGRAWPGIDVQVKSCSRPRRSGSVWRFGELNELQFNRLADDYIVPRYLFIVMVPDDPNQYADISADGMLLRFQGYYLSLGSEDPIDNPNKNRKRTVHIPVGNVLTVTTLRTLMFPPCGPGGA